jgi:tetratricopeptide (TPR) repeat protein
MRSTALIVALIVMLLPQIARSQPDEPSPRAEKIEKEAIELYGRGEYAEAAKAFEAAYALAQRPALIYAWAQAERFAGQCDKALDLYDRFLATGPNENDTNAARYAREICARKLGRDGPQADPPDPSQGDPSDDAGAQSAAPSLRPEPPRAVDEPRPWYRDGWGYALAGIGLASLATAPIAFRVADDHLDEARAADRHDEFERGIDSHRRWRQIGTTTAIVGGVALAGALARFLWAGAEASEEPDGVAQLDVHIGPSSASAGLLLRF